MTALTQPQVPSGEGEAWTMTDIRQAPPGAKAITYALTITRGEREALRAAIKRLLKPLSEQNEIDETNLLSALTKIADAERADIPAPPGTVSTLPRQGVAVPEDLRELVERLEVIADNYPDHAYIREPITQAIRALLARSDAAPDAVGEAKLDEISTLLHEFNPYASDWAFRRGVILDLLLEVRAALARAETSQGQGGQDNG